MKLETKHVLLAMLFAFGIKSLISGVSYEASACLAVLGGTLFLYERARDNNEIKKLQELNSQQNQELTVIKKDVEALKSYVSSQKMNGLRSAGGYPGTQR